MTWWHKLLSKLAGAEPQRQPRATSSAPPSISPAPETKVTAAQKRSDQPGSRLPNWLAEDDPGNPFGVPILNLMGNLELISTTTDPAIAERSVSWRAAQQDRLRWELRGRMLDCDLEYTVEAPPPAGMLFIPKVMEDKWVFALKGSQIAVARSWTGDTQILADVRIEGARLHVVRLTVAETCNLDSFGEPSVIFDWMMETHVLEQRVPLPASAEGLSMLRSRPMTGISVFGHRLFCAARNYALPHSGHPVRSDGELVAALDAANLAQVRTLLDRGARVDTPSRHLGYRPLHRAVLVKSPELIRLLLERGADPNQPADRMRRPLPLAIVMGCPDAILEQLIHGGAELEPADNKGFRPLHAAAEVGSVAAIRFLVERGAELEPRTLAGVTPLHISCALGHLNAAKELVRLGCDPNVTSPLGTPLQAARQENKTEIVQWLESL